MQVTKWDGVSGMSERQGAAAGRKKNCTDLQLMYSACFQEKQLRVVSFGKHWHFPSTKREPTDLPASLLLLLLHSLPKKATLSPQFKSIWTILMSEVVCKVERELGNGQLPKWVTDIVYPSGRATERLTNLPPHLQFILTASAFC